MLENHLYHVYNRGNNRQNIFFSSENYRYFLQKIRLHLLPVCDFLAYCLMPNHFHFLIRADARTVEVIAQSNRDIALTAFSKGLRTTLSSYTRGIQKQEKFTGSLFQQKTKIKQVSSEWQFEDYTLICFRYILNNPVRAGLVRHPAEWEFSSFRDTLGMREDSLCNLAWIRQELAQDRNTLEDLVGLSMEESDIRHLW